MSRGHTGSTVCEGDGLLWANVQAMASCKQEVRGWAGAQALGEDDVGVDAFFNQCRQPREFEHWQGAGAGGDHRAPEARVAGGLEIATRSGEGRHSALV